ncbi:hypothetical protein ACFQWG_04470 [Schaalia naturae]|uniref:Uncharacterized protein n=1 Tax=Schaalia naturae TaxID=635203 RepID=A0ABW2SJZ8_9ACTO
MPTRRAALSALAPGAVAAPAVAGARVAVLTRSTDVDALAAAQQEVVGLARWAIRLSAGATGGQAQGR